MASTAVESISVGDGSMAVHIAKPDGLGKSPAVIVIQEIFGVDPHIQDVTTRLADAGYFAVAPELFHRAGSGVVVPYDEMEKARGQRGELSNDDILADLNATVAYLQSSGDVDGAKIGIVGFCFGGYVSYLGAVQVPGIKASAVFYGGGITPRADAPAGAPNLLAETADNLSVPMIGFWGDQDQGIPADSVKTIESTLKGKGKNYESHSYVGAGHGFFCDDRGSYNEAAASDAWPKTMEFFGKHLS